MERADTRHQGGVPRAGPARRRRSGARSLRLAARRFSVRQLVGRAFLPREFHRCKCRNSKRLRLHHQPGAVWSLLLERHAGKGELRLQVARELHAAFGFPREHELSGIVRSDRLRCVRRVLPQRRGRRQEQERRHAHRGIHHLHQLANPCRARPGGAVSLPQMARPQHLLLALRFVEYGRPCGDRLAGRWRNQRSARADDGNCRRDVWQRHEVRRWFALRERG